MIRPLIGLTLAAIATPALAHVTVSPLEAPAGGQVTASFRIGHGCDGKATTALRIEIPSGIPVKVRPLAGWKIKVETQQGQPTAVTWRGRLPEEGFQDFDLLLRMPMAQEPIYFGAIQTCGSDVIRWTEKPRGDEVLVHPAPVLTVVPNAEAPSHQHHH